MNGHDLSLDEGLRDFLRNGKAPEALRLRLRTEARRQDRRHVTSRILAAAACLLLVLTGIGVWRGYLLDPAPQLAQQAFADFQASNALDFKGEPPAQGENCCLEWSRRTVGFSAPIPSCVETCCIQGGRGCKIGGRPAAYYKLDAGRGLYVFKDPIRRQPDAPRIDLPLPAFGHAHLWNEGGRAYLLLEPKPR